MRYLNLRNPTDSDLPYSFTGARPTTTTRVTLCRYRGLLNRLWCRWLPGLRESAHRTVEFTKEELTIRKRDGQRLQRLEVYILGDLLEHLGVRALHTTAKLGVMVPRLEVHGSTE